MDRNHKAIEVPSVEELRRFAKKPFLAWLWVMVPLAALTAHLNGNALLAPTIAALVSAAAAQLAVGLFGIDRQVPRQVMAASAVISVSSLVLAAAGPWQIDFHMIYFAMLAMLVPFCDWRMILTAAAVTAVHHLALSFLLPWAVFPGSADITRVLFHAVVVVMEVAALLVINARLTALLGRARAAVAQSEAQRQEIEELMDREKSLAEANAHQRDALMREVAEQMQTRVGAVINRISSTVEHLNTDAGNLSRAMETAAGGVEEFGSGAVSARDKAASLETAANDLRAAIESVSEMAVNSSDRAKASSGQTGSAREALSELKQNIDGVSEVVRSIGEIAAQTNLLALNATIESARAGEAGKGFAVVASEVKDLADQTQKLTDGVFNQIAKVKESAERAIGSAYDATQAIDSINDLLEEIRDTAANNARLTESVLSDIRDVTTVTEHVSGAIESTEGAIREAGDVSAHVVQATGGLADGAQELDRAVQGFLAGVGQSAEIVELPRAAA